MARAIRASTSSALIVHSENGFDSRKLDEGRMTHPPFGMPSALRAQLWSAQNCSPQSRIPVSLNAPTMLPRAEVLRLWLSFSNREQVDNQPPQMAKAARV